MAELAYFLGGFLLGALVVGIWALAVTAPNYPGGPSGYD